MSLSPVGAFRKFTGELAAVGKQLKSVTLAPVSAVRVVFDPFHPAAANCRHFVYYLTGPKIRNTNENCKIKTEIACDGRDPFVVCTLTPEAAEKFKSSTIKFEANRLTHLELFRLYNQYVTPLAPEKKPTAVATPSAKTKGKKKK